MTRLCSLGELTLPCPPAAADRVAAVLTPELGGRGQSDGAASHTRLLNPGKSPCGGQELTLSFRRQCEEEGCFVTGVTKASMPNRN